MSAIYVHDGGDGFRLECWAGTRTDMPAVVQVCPVKPGATWDDLAAKVREHQAAHGCGDDTEGEPQAVTFTVDGEIFSMQAEPKQDPKEQCLCCRPLGHVFCYGVHVPSVTRPGINGGRVPGDVDDWIRDLLYRDYRRDGGRKVRITLEILPADATQENR